MQRDHAESVGDDGDGKEYLHGPYFDEVSGDHRPDDAEEGDGRKQKSHLSSSFSAIGEYRKINMVRDPKKKAEDYQKYERDRQEYKHIFFCRKKVCAVDGRRADTCEHERFAKTKAIQKLRAECDEEEVSNTRGRIIRHHERYVSVENVVKKNREEYAEESTRHSHHDAPEIEAEETFSKFFVGEQMI